MTTSHPLFVMDTASDLILVDRTGHSGETLGDQTKNGSSMSPSIQLKERLARPCCPPRQAVQTSMLTGRPLEVGGLTSPVCEDDEGATMPDRDRDRTRVGLGVEAGEEHAGEEHYLSLASLTLGPTTLTTSTSTFLPTRPPR